MSVYALFKAKAVMRSTVRFPFLLLVPGERVRVCVSLRLSVCVGAGVKPPIGVNV